MYIVHWIGRKLRHDCFPPLASIVPQLSSLRYRIIIIDVVRGYLIGSMGESRFLSKTRPLRIFSFDKYIFNLLIKVKLRLVFYLGICMFLYHSHFTFIIFFNKKERKVSSQYTTYPFGTALRLMTIKLTLTFNSCKSRTNVSNS